MLNCRQITRLVSQSMDAKLPWHQRLAVRVHLLYCSWCRRYASQIQFLRKATKELANLADDEAPERLSEDAKAKIQQTLRQAMNEDRPQQ
jgi:hypothetical protein